MGERRNVSSGSPYEPKIGFSRAVVVGDRVLVSGTAPVWPDGSCDPDAEAQARRCFEIVVEALAALEARPEDVVRTRMFLTDASYGGAVGRVHGEVFGATRPAATMVVVAELLDPRWKVEVEAEAIVASYRCGIDPLRRARSAKDVARYFTSSHWNLGVTWTWVVGAFVTFTGGILTYRAVVDARKFAQLARSLPAVDLLDREALLPFARQGLRSAVPGVIFVTFLALNLGDTGFLLATALIGTIVTCL